MSGLTEAPLAIETGERIPKHIEPTSLVALATRVWERIPLSFERIQDTIAEQAGGRLPDALADRLSFRAKGTWQMVYDGRALPLLFLHSPTSQVDEIKVEDADGSIYIDRAPSARNDKVFVSKIGVAGVGLDSDDKYRVLAVEYLPFGRRNAIGINVSVLDKEYPYDTHYSGHSLESIPTRLMMPGIGYTDGIVTQRMVLATGEVNNNYPKVLRAYDATHKGDKLYFGDIDYLSGRNGFTVVSTVDNHTISYNPPKFRKSDSLRPWSVDFPKSLVRV